jgi:DNA-binding NarL/FixJ family response regulator
MSKKKIRVLIADDQRLMHDGLRIILEDAEDIEPLSRRTYRSPDWTNQRSVE